MGNSISKDVKMYMVFQGDDIKYNGPNQKDAELLYESLPLKYRGEKIMPSSKRQLIEYKPLKED